MKHAGTALQVVLLSLTSSSARPSWSITFSSFCCLWGQSERYHRGVQTFLHISHVGTNNIKGRCLHSLHYVTTSLGILLRKLLSVNSAPSSITSICIHQIFTMFPADWVGFVSQQLVNTTFRVGSAEASSKMPACHHDDSVLFCFLSLILTL